MAFARALLKNPSMLLLDEATSSLDTLTERRIQSSLAQSRDDRTTVIVAHRLSTIMDADLIVCFKVYYTAMQQCKHDTLKKQEQQTPQTVLTHPAILWTVLMLTRA